MFDQHSYFPNKIHIKFRCIFDALLMHFWCTFDALLMHFEKRIKSASKCIKKVHQKCIKFKRASKVQKCITNFDLVHLFFSKFNSTFLNACSHKTGSRGQEKCKSVSISFFLIIFKNPPNQRFLRIPSKFFEKIMRKI